MENVNMEELKKDPVKFIEIIAKVSPLTAKSLHDVSFESLGAIVRDDERLMQYADYIEKLINGENFIFSDVPRYGKSLTVAYVVKKIINDD